MRKIAERLAPILWRNTRDLRRAVREVPTVCRYKAIFSVRRLLGSRGQINFYPSLPPVTAAMFKMCMELGWAMKVGFDRSVPTIFWASRESPDEHPYVGLINGNCININKSTVTSLFEKTFGYGYEVDPKTCRCPYVRKSELNATHDGIVLYEPSQPKRNFVYQRLLNNELGNGLVEDLRLIYMRGVLPFFFRKQRSVTSRFANENADVSIEQTLSFLTERELKKIDLLSRAIGIDYGEFDVVRDRSSDLLYVLDINRTPAGPPNGLPRGQSHMAVREMAAAFKTAFSRASSVST